MVDAFNKIHPGQLIKDGYMNSETYENAADMASAMNMSAFTLQEILDGKESITNEISIKLGKLMNVPADYWLISQQIYDETVIEEEKFAMLQFILHKIANSKTEPTIVEV